MCAVELSGGGALFRGFLVQARAQADQSPEGSFSVSGPEQRLSSCVTPEVGATLAILIHCMFSLFYCCVVSTS